MAKKSNNSTPRKRNALPLNKIAFWTLVVAAVMYLVSVILNAASVDSIIVRWIQGVAMAIAMIYVAIHAYRYIKGKQVVWLVLYIVCLLIVIIGIILPLVL